MEGNYIMMNNSFLCKSHNCEMLPKACILRQYNSKRPVKKNPLSAYNFDMIDYLKCSNCDQGKEILKQNKLIYKEIVKEKINIKNRRTSKKIKYKCKYCGEINIIKFNPDRKTVCKECKNKMQRIYYKNRKEYEENES